MRMRRYSRDACAFLTLGALFVFPGCGTDLSPSEEQICGNWKARHRDLELELIFKSNKEYQLKENGEIEDSSGHWFVDGGILVLRKWSSSKSEKYFVAVRASSLILGPIDSNRLATTWQKYDPPWYSTSVFKWAIGIAALAIIVILLCAASATSRQPTSGGLDSAVAWVEKQVTDWSEAREEKKEIERLRRSKTRKSLEDKRRK